MTDTTQTEESKSVGEVVREAFQELGSTLIAFVKAPKALWGVNIPYVIEGLVYFGILTILGKYCSENVGLSDLQAGWVYSVVTAGITFAMLFLGGVCDKIGIPRTLTIAFFMFVVGRGLVALSGTMDLGQGLGSPMFLVMALGLATYVVAYGLYQPAAYAGVKRYTNPKTAAMGYAVVYGLMNLGAFFSGFVSPIVRHRFEGVFPPNGLTAVFWTYTALCAIALVITLMVLTRKTDAEAVERVARETAELGDSDENASKDEETASVAKPANLLFIVFVSVAAISIGAAIAATTGRLAIAPWITYVAAAGLITLSVFEFLRVRPDHPFRDGRFTFFIFILIPVQIVAGLTARANVYTMMIIGTLVMALPTFLLVIGPHLVPFLAYILLMSIGEAMWQPRFLQWIAEVAPPGKTGLYMGIGQFPWFLTKFVTGLYSGYFVATYIPRPETGLPTNTEFMWLIYGVIAMISPIALILARKWMMAGMMEKHEG
ncbi:MAG: MFS transporter [Acidobacteria bacterium]|nr:MFS transporter [Candidatus Sulfomarinibacter kjeldsenii]